jgi:hypothetical protein
MSKNIIIYTHMPQFSFVDGGTIVQYELARILKELGKNVKIFSSSGICLDNLIFNEFYNNEFPIDDNAVVIYCEGTIGNPLNAKNVVRWMLSELGQNVPFDFLNTWNKNELVYYFNSELKFLSNPEKMGSIYKLLNCIYINPFFKIYNLKERKGVCYSIRKAKHIHGDNFKMVHPKGSVEITKNHNNDDYIKIFNNHKWFMCYDPLSFLFIISALCGCIPVVLKIDGLNKQEWLQKTVAAEYLKYKGLDNLYGVAYGREDMQYAIDTLHLVKDQWDDIINYSKEKTIIPFINDIQNFENMKNTIQNNFFFLT